MTQTETTTEILNRLLRLALTSDTAAAFAHGLVRQLGTLPQLSADRQCTVLEVVGLRTLRVLASTQDAPVQCAEWRQPDCPYAQVVRNGETAVLSRALCPQTCTCRCTDGQHLVPLKHPRTSRVIGVLALSVDPAGAATEEQLALLKAVAAVAAPALAKLTAFEHAELLSAMVHDTPYPCFACDPSGEVLYANPAVKKILWQQSIEQEHLLPANHVEYVRSCAASQGTETVHTEVGDYAFAWCYRYVAERDKVFVFGQDISEQKRIETQLAHDAMHDALTGLPNRNHLLSTLKSELAVQRKRPDYRFALLLIDLDRFKTVIESLGFSAGNLVLRTVADRLRQWDRHDHFVARLGGDEFAVIFEDIDNVSRIVDLADSINADLSAPVPVRENNITLTVSIGVAIGDGSTSSPEEILQNASAAVYRAKRAGSNRTEVYDKEMHLAALARLRVHNELADAMDSGDLTVFYQPVFGLNDLRIRGFEALARWRHPERGLLGPGEFIPIAEETGLIHEVGTFVLKTVCRQLASWRRLRLPLAWVSVNVSAHQFQLDHLVEDIMRYVTEAGADPARLYVEITEGTAAASPERAFEMMSRLRDNGIRIALDDFGTGYSSMSYLKRFPIDTLKLDRSFITGLPESQDDAAIATSVIAMAKSLGMKVVAEGVEDERQAMFLRTLGCDEVQGFLYGKPMPAQHATNLLRTGRLASKRRSVPPAVSRK